MTDAPSTTVVDLDAKRAARRERNGQATQVLLGGQLITLATELPLEALDLINGEINGDALISMLAATPEDVAKLNKARPTLEDLMELIELFGITLGESSGSASSSALSTPAEP